VEGVKPTAAAPGSAATSGGACGFVRFGERGAGHAAPARAGGAGGGRLEQAMPRASSGWTGNWRRGGAGRPACVGPVSSGALGLAASWMALRSRSRQVFSTGARRVTDRARLKFTTNLLAVTVPVG
jgi:hypothetical protein